MAETELPELWGFNDSDLAFNRLGKLTEKQNAFLAGEHKTQSRVFWASVVPVYLMRANRKEVIAVQRAEGTARYTWGTKRVRTPTSSVHSYEDVQVLHLNLGDRKFEVT
ncbi:MAG TPA: hypothetical protein VN843_21140 [Anaerolineales bacterium]|nr:hypothetical protein [Anaerolineales bacterium]